MSLPQGPAGPSGQPAPSGRKPLHLWDLHRVGYRRQTTWLPARFPDRRVAQPPAGLRPPLAGGTMPAGTLHHSLQCAQPDASRTRVNMEHRLTSLQALPEHGGSRAGRPATAIWTTAAGFPPTIRRPCGRHKPDSAGQFCGIHVTDCSGHEPDHWPECPSDVPPGRNWRAPSVRQRRH